MKCYDSNTHQTTSLRVDNLPLMEDLNYSDRSKIFGGVDQDFELLSSNGNIILFTRCSQPGGGSISSFKISYADGTSIEFDTRFDP